MQGKAVLAFGLFVVGVAVAKPHGFGWGPPPPPPNFDWLPAEAQQKLKAIHEDHSLGWTEKKEMIDAVFDSLPQSVLSKMPPPPGFDRLPKETQDRFNAVHNNDTLTWAQRREKIHEIIESLPEEQRRLLPHGPHFGPRGFPPHPPPGFKEALPTEAFEKLVAIHGNKDLSESQKKQQIDDVMKALPKDVIAKLPLPPKFNELPAEAQEKARSILNDFSVDFDTRHKNLREFIRTLPEDQQKLVRPPRPWGPHGPHGFPNHPPPDFKGVLPTEAFQKLEAIFAENISHEEKMKKMDAVLGAQSQEVIDKLPIPPPFRNLPADAQAKVKAIFHNFQLSHEERREQVRKFLDSLPEEVRKLVPRPPFGGPHGPMGPRGPPPDWKDVLPADVWEKLEAIHAKQLSREERHKETDAVLKALPKETLEKLPLPPHLRGLPADVQAKIRTIMGNFEVGFEDRKEEVRKYIDTLPEEVRKTIPPKPHFRHGFGGPRGPWH
uniref:SXP/RAL-2 family protein Ani s 5-like cation-binding domain-containing protein n=1 Tax=Panagrellus redivivus TaxID=6233 RepID=A0A7E4ZXJ7_PANRE